jgi:NAD(P)-dependent dehydrogenase (short-subunit alcohol dehydrogenase family)
MKSWNTANIESQKGKLVVVTGATGGLGYECALALAAAGAEVILAGRNSEKGDAALAKLREAGVGGTARFEIVDLASLASVHQFADRLLTEGKPIDVLINNAAVMSLPKRGSTADGFELQFGTNHLSHFALTAKLLPILIRANKPVVTTVSSLAHRRGKINFKDLQAERHYQPWSAYQQSKLANLLFTFELQRRSDDNGWRLTSNAAHPGYARTDLIPNGPGANSLFAKLSLMWQPYISHSAAAGALPVLFAAVAPEAEACGYYGPNGFYELKGPVAKAFIAPQAKDVLVAKRLWEESEKLVGIRFPEEIAKVQRSNLGKSL